MSDDADELAPFDGKGHIVQRLVLEGSSGGIYMIQVFDL